MIMIDNTETVVWGHEKNQPLVGRRCQSCEGNAPLPHGSGFAECEECGGLGWTGIDPHKPVTAAPGSAEKVAMLSVRYAAGWPLWNEQDGPEPEVPAHLRASDDGASENLLDLLEIDRSSNSVNLAP